MKTSSNTFSTILALCALLSLSHFASSAQGAWPFVVGGRVLSLSEPFRPGATYETHVTPSGEAREIMPRVKPAPKMSVLESVSPTRVVPHYLPKEGDYTPRHYDGLTVVQIPPRTSYTPDPLTATPPALQGAISPYPSTIPGPRIVTPQGLRPGHDPFRPSPFDPDVTRRQGFRNF